MSNWICPEHQQVKFVPPGVSTKTGQPVPYEGFFCCPVKGCKQRPPKGAAVVMASPIPTGQLQRPAQQPKPAPDWDKIAAGKVRCAMWCAWAAGSRPWSEYWSEFEGGFKHIMSGSIPGFDERWEALDEAPFPET